MKPDFLDQLEEWNKQDKFKKIVRAIKALPQTQWNYQIIGHLARALNNLSQYEEAAEVLLLVEKQGLNDPGWNYCLGYAYYYGGSPKQAKRLFERVLELTPDNQNAQHFIAWCNKALAENEGPSELDNRLMVSSQKIFGKTFRQRTDEFWEWFTQNEAILSEMSEQRATYGFEEMARFVSQGTDLICEDLNVSLGEGYTLTFAVEDKIWLFYLLPWVIARMPEQWRSKWQFFTGVPETNCETFLFDMGEKKISFDEVYVKMHYFEEDNYFDLHFYEKQLCSLGEEEASDAFYTMLGIAIGEGKLRAYINEVKMVHEPEENMFPLPQLIRRMEAAFSYMGKNSSLKGDECYSGYKLQPSPNKILRGDVVAGTTCFFELVDEYYTLVTRTADAINKCNAWAVFLTYPYLPGENAASMLNICYGIQERLQKEVLGEKGSGQENGIVLGNAMGERYAYVDLLLYDVPDFLAKVEEVLKDYPYAFYLSEFYQNGDIVPLSGVKKELMLLPDEPSEEARKIIHYLDCPCRWFAPMKDDTPLDEAYARALEKGKEQGFIPVWVKADPLLLEQMEKNTPSYHNRELSLKEIRDYRKKLLEETELPDGKKLLAAWIDERKRQVIENEIDWEGEIIGEIADGVPDQGISSYWSFDYPRTDEMLLAYIPVDAPWKVFAWLPMSYGDTCPKVEEMMAVAKYWYEEYQAVPVALTHNELEFRVGALPKAPSTVLQLSLEHYVFCRNCIEQSDEDDTVGQHADALRESSVWYFWWD